MAITKSAKVFYLFWGVLSYTSSALAITCLILNSIKIFLQKSDTVTVIAVWILLCCISLFLYMIFKVCLSKVWRLHDPYGLKIQSIRLSTHTTFWFPLVKSLFDLGSSVSIRDICSAYKEEKYQFIPVAAFSAYFGVVASFSYGFARGFGQMVMVVTSTAGFFIIFLMGDHLSKWTWVPVLCVVLVTAGVGFSYWKFRPAAVMIFTEETVEATELTELPTFQRLRDFADAYHWSWLGVVAKVDEAD